MYIFDCFVVLFLSLSPSPCLFQLGWLIDLIDDIVDCYHLSARREIIISYLFQLRALRGENRSHKQPGLAADSDQQILLQTEQRPTPRQLVG